MQTFLIRIDARAYIQRAYELWAKTFPKQNLHTLTQEQKTEIHALVDAEFQLDASLGQRLRENLYHSSDVTRVIAPFMLVYKEPDLMSAETSLMTPELDLMPAANFLSRRVQ